MNDFCDDAADLSLGRMRHLRDMFTRDRPRPKCFDDVHERVIWSDNPGVFDKRADNPESARELVARMCAARKRQNAAPSSPRHPNKDERRLYDGIDALVRDCYSGPLVNETTFGFVMTIYRRRLVSSARAYARTVRNLLERRQTPLQWDDLRPDDAPDDDEPLPSPPLSSDQKDVLRRRRRPPKPQRFQIRRIHAPTRRPSRRRTRPHHRIHAVSGHPSLPHRPPKRRRLPAK